MKHEEQKTYFVLECKEDDTMEKTRFINIRVFEQKSKQMENYHKTMFN